MWIHAKTDTITHVLTSYSSVKKQVSGQEGLNIAYNVRQRKPRANLFRAGKTLKQIKRERGERLTEGLCHSFVFLSRDLIKIVVSQLIFLCNTRDFPVSYLLGGFPGLSVSSRATSLWQLRSVNWGPTRNPPQKQEKPKTSSSVGTDGRAAFFCSGLSFDWV